MAIRPQILAGFTVLIWAALGGDSLSAEGQQNVLSSTDASVLLKHWSIAADVSPYDSAHFPSDSVWQQLLPSTEHEQFARGNWLIRTQVMITDSAGGKSPLGLFPTRFVTAYEIYWDGTQVARNGVAAADQAHERAGPFDLNVLLPSHLTTPGKHTIVVRISNHQGFSAWRWYYGGLTVGRYESELRAAFRTSSRAFFIIGILFVPLLFNLFLYFARSKRAEHLLLSLICFLVVIDTATGQMPLLTDVSTLYVHWELIIYQILTVLLGILFPAFLVYLFSIPRRIIALVVALNVAVVIFFSEFWNMFGAMSLVVLVLSSVMTAWAVWRRREDSVIVLLAMAPAWIAYMAGFAFAGLAAIMVVCTSLSTARNMARKERAEQEAHLRSIRLENELLRKNINPHFLLNTLTSIIAWLRKDTKSAIKLIEALGEEFRMVSQMSALKRITVRKEIELCEAHLRIMSYRKGAEFRLETIDIVEDEEIPPMIFHTLIENGLTHGYENKTHGTFTLQRRSWPGFVQYRLFNDGDFADIASKDSSGFGLKYVRTRLEETYPDRWKVESRRCEQGWESIIEIEDR